MCVCVQGEQTVSDLRGGGAVRDGKRFVAEETFALGKVRCVRDPNKVSVFRIINLSLTVSVQQVG